MQTQYSAKQIIDALGGCIALSRQLGMSRSGITSWVYRGIPSRWQLDNAKLIRKAERIIESKNNSVQL